MNNGNLTNIPKDYNTNMTGTLDTKGIELNEGPIFQSRDKEFQKISDGISDLLKYKNRKYGNSALDPINIFSGKTKVGDRLDDKLSRVKNSTELKKNDITDILGYLILVCSENGWTSFDEFKD